MKTSCSTVSTQHFWFIHSCDLSVYSIYPSICNDEALAFFNKVHHKTLLRHTAAESLGEQVFDRRSGEIPTPWMSCVNELEKALL